MRLTLPVRIVLIHLVFTVGALAVAVPLVQRSFRQYRDEWKRSIETLPPESLLTPLAHEVARSLLLRLEQPYPEVQEANQRQISEGLRAILRELPSVESLVIVDHDGRIRYHPDPQQIEQGFTGERRAAYLTATEPTRRQVPLPGGLRLTEVIVPVWEERGVPAGEGGRRLGTLVIRYRPDPGLAERLPNVTLPSIETRDFAFPVVLLLVATAIGAVLVAAGLSVPVRRLDRALAEFRRRDFRGGLDLGPHGVQGELAGAVATINELSGRFEALDARWREREALLSTLSHSLEEGMVAVDPAGKPVTWNAAALRILAPSALRGDAAGSDGPLSEEVEVVAALLRNPELVPGAGYPSGHEEVEIRRDDGERLPVQVTRVPFEFRSGENGTLLLLRDLATLRKVEVHLLEAGRYAVLAHLAAGLAHEIRNPLHAIGLNVGAVQEWVRAEPVGQRASAIEEALDTIQTEARRLTDLLNNYLGLVRPSSQPELVDVHDLCRKVVQLLEYSARRAHVQLHLQGDPSLPEVLGVGDRIQQAILNLVLNAVQAMPGGGAVTVTTAYDANTVKVTVTDTGPGLSPEVQEHLFDVRVTTKPAGTGLGLPLARMIAESHGGTLWARSTPGAGASFTLVLPVRMAATA